NVESALRRRNAPGAELQRRRTMDRNDDGMLGPFASVNLGGREYTLAEVGRHLHASLSASAETDFIGARRKVTVGPIDDGKLRFGSAAHERAARGGGLLESLPIAELQALGLVEDADRPRGRVGPRSVWSTEPFEEVDAV